MSDWKAKEALKRLRKGHQSIPFVAECLGLNVQSFTFWLMEVMSASEYSRVVCRRGCGEQFYHVGGFGSGPGGNTFRQRMGRRHTNS